MPLPRADSRHSQAARSIGEWRVDNAKSDGNGTSKAAESDRQIEIIIHDLLYQDIRNARISKHNFTRWYALAAFILRDMVVSPVVSKPLC